MYDFSSTEEAITFSLADFSIGPYTKGLVLEELNSFKTDLLVFLLPCHCVLYLPPQQTTTSVRSSTCMYTGHMMLVGRCMIEVRVEYSELKVIYLLFMHKL